MGLSWSRADLPHNSKGIASIGTAARGSRFFLVSGFSFQIRIKGCGDVGSVLYFRRTGLVPDKTARPMVFSVLLCAPVGVVGIALVPGPCLLSALMTSSG